jgi:hypothetical protein
MLSLQAKEAGDEQIRAQFDLAHFIRRRLACGSKGGDEAVGLA